MIANHMEKVASQFVRLPFFSLLWEPHCSCWSASWGAVASFLYWSLSIYVAVTRKFRDMLLCIVNLEHMFLQMIHPFCGSFCIISFLRFPFTFLCLLVLKL